MVLVLLRVDPILEDEYRISEQSCVAWLQKREILLELHSGMGGFMLFVKDNLITFPVPLDGTHLVAVRGLIH